MTTRSRSASTGKGAVERTAPSVYPTTGVVSQSDPGRTARDLLRTPGNPLPPPRNPGLSPNAPVRPVPDPGPRVNAPGRRPDDPGILPGDPGRLAKYRPFRGFPGFLSDRSANFSVFLRYRMENLATSLRGAISMARSGVAGFTRRRTGSRPSRPSPRSSASPRKYGVAKSSTWQRGLFALSKHCLHETT